MVPFFIATGIILSLPFLVTSPKTTVILLDTNQSKNAVDVSTDAGRVTLDEPYTATSLSLPSQQPLPSQKVDPAMINQKYGDILEALPKKPVSTLFYFEEGSTRLTPDSSEKVSLLIQLIKDREPCVVDIIGHSDTQGDAQVNYALALKRAETVKSFLDEKEAQIKQMTLQSFGESDLLIPTADNVAEPKNRRVEVIVR